MKKIVIVIVILAIVIVYAFTKPLQKGGSYLSDDFYRTRGR